MSGEPERRHLVFTVAWCDPYLGYTLYQWLLEVKDIIESEYGVKIAVAEEPGSCSGEGDPRLLVDGETVLVGLPGEEGYLIEAVKKALEDLGIRPRGGVD